jgi:hypothetical protein
MYVTLHLPCEYIHSPKTEIVLFIPMTILVVLSRSSLRSNNMDEQKEMLSTTQMRSSSILIYEVVNTKAVGFKPSQNYSAIKVLFNPDKLNASSFGIAPAPLRIEVPGNAQIRQYVI